MKILVCASTELEVPDSIKKFPDINILIHGVGAANASYSLGRFMATNTPDFAIQIGIAGSYDPTIKIGDVVQVVKDRFADLGSEDNDGTILDLADMPFITTSNPFISKEIINNNDLLADEYHKVHAVTVNMVSGYQPSIDRMIKLYHPQIETMEGAAFLAAMEINKIPCIQIRAIANKVEPRNRNLWNIPLAIFKLEKAIQHILQQINSVSY